MERVMVVQTFHLPVRFRVGNRCCLAQAAPFSSGSHAGWSEGKAHYQCDLLAMHVRQKGRFIWLISEFLALNDVPET